MGTGDLNFQATSFPGSFPWLGGGAGKAREKTLGTRLNFQGASEVSLDMFY